VGIDLKSVYEDALKAEFEGKKEEAIQLYEVAGSSGYPMAYIKLGDMQKNSGKDFDALEYYRLSAIIAPSDPEVTEELRKRNVIIRPSNESSGKKNEPLKAAYENTRRGFHQHLSLYSLMMFLAIVFIFISVYHFIKMVDRGFNLSYLIKLFWDIIVVLVCYKMSYLAEDADKMNRKIVNLEARVYELEQYKDYIKLSK
jgi:TPR repeat protein